MRQFRRVLLIGIVTLLLILLIGGFFAGRHAAAQASESPRPECYYTSIRIERGDTLWAIASRYKWDGQSTQSYVDDLMEMNHLSGSEITAGQYLMIYYYGETPAGE